MSSVQDVIDEVKTALAAVNWVTTLGENVVVDDTPERWYTMKERREAAIVHLFGGGSDFVLIPTRQGKVYEQPTFYASVVRHIGVDAASRISSEQMAFAEEVAARAFLEIKNAIVASSRFWFVRVERPERYDVESLSRGDFVATFAFTVTDQGSMI